MTRFLPHARKRFPGGGYGLVAEYTLTFGTVTGAGASSTFTSSQTAAISVKLLLNGMGVSGQTVTWEVLSADNSANLAVTSANRLLKTGLAWGGAPKNQTDATDVTISGTNTSATDGSGEATIQLTDIMGERTVVVKASVIVDGQTQETPPPHMPVTFGKGPLQHFKAPLSGTYRWANYTPISYTGNSNVANFPAADACGTSLSAAELRGLPDGYHEETRLPSREQLRAVARNSGHGAWYAAGWPDNWYWTGEVNYGGSFAFIVDGNGYGTPDPADLNYPVVCLR